MKSTDAATVFIVDDDPSVRESVQDLIESVGLRCKSFATPQESLDKRGGGGTLNAREHESSTQWLWEA